MHPDKGTVDVFTRIEPEDEVCLMSGTAEGRVSEVARLIDMALAQGELTTRDVKGAALIPVTQPHAVHLSPVEPPYKCAGDGRTAGWSPGQAQGEEPLPAC